MQFSSIVSFIVTNRKWQNNYESTLKCQEFFVSFATTYYTTSSKRLVFITVQIRWFVNFVNFEIKLKKAIIDNASITLTANKKSWWCWKRKWPSTQLANLLTKWWCGSISDSHVLNVKVYAYELVNYLCNIHLIVLK